MKFSAKERTGLRAMVEFARQHGQGPIPLSEIARLQDLPLPYLERVAASLRNAGLLDSVRGAAGGYSLARDPESISIGDIFRAVEGSLTSLECLDEEGGHCERESICAARMVWQKVSDRLHETLDNTSLSDLLR
ncbi:MAG: Rrf2 family transcriptional regulator [Chloroflexi bacterium]|jgi:Rrf2 family cysteine metabolism transcriptional repressor|nr:Rrf2 family transcriptional regulator [Chloroflexota bacterium]